jgi:hypothetical protein
MMGLLKTRDNPDQTWVKSKRESIRGNNFLPCTHPGDLYTFVKHLSIPKKYI